MPLSRGLMNSSSSASASSSSSRYQSRDCYSGSAHLPLLRSTQSADDVYESQNINFSDLSSYDRRLRSETLPLIEDSNESTMSTDSCIKPVPATPDHVVKLYADKLTKYELSEIFSYPEVYFIGADAKKRKPVYGSNNCNFDSDQGTYIHVPHDHIAYRYEVIKVIGKGSFGQVIKAYDHKNLEHIALKMVRNEKRFHRQATEEVRILEVLRKKDKDNTMNVIHMYDHFTFRKHMCITFELLSINLYELIKKNKFQGFSLQLVRKFCHSLLQCLDGLYANKIIHCDLKPENILLKQHGRSSIKVSLILLSLILCDSFETNWSIVLAGNRLRIELLRGRMPVHVHTVAVLPGAGSNNGFSLRHGHRYVEFGLHTMRAIHRISASTGRRRKRPIRLYRRATRHATQKRHQRW